MKNLKYLWVFAPILIGVIAGFVFTNFAVGAAVFAVLLLPVFVKIYIPYAKDNPKHLWFKRKLFGWGWTPVTWQGWIVTLLYIVGILSAIFSSTKNPTSLKTAFAVILVALFTIIFFVIAFKKGEKPRWQWGIERRD